MLQSRNNTVLVIYLIALCLIGPLIFWLSYRGGNASLQATQQTPVGSLFNSSKNPAAQRRMSLGNRVLITADNNPDKQAGVQAFTSRDYEKAVNKFSASLQINRNDPETWIYLNNATAATKNNNTASGKSDIIQLGVSVPIGGNLNVAREILRGVAQAQYEVNHNGGVQGKLIQIEIANDDNDPAIAKQIAIEFVKAPRILAVIGHNSSDASIAAAPIYQQGGLVMISPTSVARDLSRIGGYVFRTTPSARAIADVLANYAVKSAHKTKIAICADSRSEASRSFVEEFTFSVFEYGGRVTNTACDFSAPKFNPNNVPSQAISDGADAVLLAPAVNKISSAVDVAQANKGRLALLGSHTLYTFQTLQQGQEDINGIVLAVAWHPTAFPHNPFVANARKFWGGPGSWRTAMSYDATMAASLGLKLSTSREELRRELANSGFSFRGATGTIRFLPSGDRQGQGILVRSQPGQISGTNYDFVPFRP